jgi:hypothetical protein
VIRPILPWPEEKQEKRTPPCRLAPLLHPHSLLEKCLPEIQTTIFALACSDEGKTGAVLALVSKNIAAQFKPYRFHSVCLPDHQSSVKFLQNTMELLGFKQRARVQNHQCHVQHFFISDGPIDFKHVPKAPARTPSNLPNFDEEWYLTFYTNRSHMQCELPRPRNTISIRRILRYMTFTLRMLTMVADVKWPDKMLKMVFDLEFPHLESLKLTSLRTLSMHIRCRHSSVQ